MQKIIERANGERPRVTLDFSDAKGRTQQQFAEDADINIIMRRWAKDGVDPRGDSRLIPRFGDFSNIADYQAANQMVIHAQEDFDELPAAIRQRMNNDPATLIAFMDDPSNVEEATTLGLLPTTAPEPTPSPDPGPSAQPPAAPEGTLSPPQPTPISGGE